MSAANWFLALRVVPGPWFDALARPPDGNRPFHRDDLHLTVAFLGPCGEAAATRAWEAALAVGVPPRLPVTLAGMRGMGPPGRPSAWSATLSTGRREVTATIERLRGPAFAAAGVRPDPRPALPHLTLARPMRRATDGQRAAGWSWANSLPVGGLPVELRSLALYTWATDRRATLFEIRQEVALPDGPVVPR